MWEDLVVDLGDIFWMWGEIESERGFCIDGFFKVRWGLGFVYLFLWLLELEVDWCWGFVEWKGIVIVEWGEV